MKNGEGTRATGRSMVFSVCEWGQREPWKWAKKVGGHLWRVSGDIGDLWNRSTDQKGGLRGVLNILEINAPLNEYAGPAGWNDRICLLWGLTERVRASVMNRKVVRTSSISHILLCGA